MGRTLAAVALAAACLAPAVTAGERGGRGRGGERGERRTPSPEELVAALAARGYAERAAAFDALLARLVESERVLAAEAGRLEELLAVKEGEEAPRVLEVEGEKFPRWVLERKREMVKCLAAELEAGRGWTRGLGDKVNLEGGVNVQVPNGTFDDYLPFLARALGAEVALSPAARRAVSNADVMVTGWATGRELLDWVEATFDLVPGMRDGKVVFRPRASAEGPADAGVPDAREGVRSGPAPAPGSEPGAQKES